MRSTTCSECGTPFTFSARRGPAPLTCSDPCKAKRAERYQRQQLDRTCVECGQPFTTHVRSQVCCGIACGLARSKRLGAATKKRETARRRARTCEQCGQPFQARNPSGRARAGKVTEGRFCSVACHTAWRRRGNGRGRVDSSSPKGL